LKHAVGVCYRCRTVIEPLLSQQWFVKTAPLAKAASDSVKDGRTVLTPKTWERTFFDWMDNIRDWCVSRQLWWGHQIPAWHCPNCAAVVVSLEDQGACPNCRAAMVRDPDVLDTWFSSALWPFSTLGWPDRTPDLARWYPTSVLVTGFDILFFWVARMMMMGLRMMGEVPFRKVVLHPLVRDAEGQKMSKSKGNVVDPLEVLESSGADAFRFTLAAQAGPTRDLRLSPKRIEGYSKFVNKLWNAARLVLGALGDQAKALAALPPARPEILPDRWIRARLAAVTAEARAALDGFHIDRYCELIYQFTWYELCDWHLELVKPVLYGQDPAAEAARPAALANLSLVMRDVLALAHPVMPFVTEELWSRLGVGPLMLAPFPAAREADADPEAVRLVGFLMDVTKAVRQARADFGVPPGAKVVPVVATADGALASLLAEQSPLLLKLMGASSLRLAAPGEAKPAASAANILAWGEVWTPLAGHVDPAAEAARLGKELAKLEKEAAAAAAKLENPGYLAKAPEEVVEETRERLAECESRRQSLERSLALLGALDEGGGR
jgi:valyl-tRNA synthetase